MGLRRRLVCIVFAGAWTAGLAYGGAQLWNYQSKAGSPAHPPLAWPTNSQAPQNPSLPTLVVLIHPHCPCSRATLEELAKLMADCDGRLTATVFMLRPTDAPASWERTDLWKSAAAIPGVTVKADDAGKMASQMGATTSGHVLLYSPQRQLLFSGGITESRGHGGDNVGRSAITALVRRDATPQFPLSTPTYGCALFEGMQADPNDKGAKCLK